MKVVNVNKEHMHMSKLPVRFDFHSKDWITFIVLVRKTVALSSSTKHIISQNLCRQSERECWFPKPTLIYATFKFIKTNFT